MKVKFIFRNECNLFTKNNDWDAIAKINLLTEEMPANVVNRVNDWLNDGKNLKKNYVSLSNVLTKMKEDKRSDNFVHRFLKSYVMSTASKFDPMLVYKAMLKNNFDKKWA